MDRFTKRLPAAGAAVASAALVLTGCSKGEGEPTPDAAANNNEEQRVAAVGLGDADTLLALDITPVAIAPWGTEGDVEEPGVGPWSKDLIGDAEPTVIYNTAQGFTADVLEEISSADPTQIIAVNQAVDAEAYDALEAIAPTTVRPEEHEDWQVPWDVQIETIAEAVDKKEEGDELVEETNQKFADFKDSHAELQGKTAAIVMPYEGKLGLYTPGDGRGQFIENLGFTIPEELEGDGSSFFVDYAPENYAELNDVDYLFVLDYNGAVDTIKEDQTFQNLDIVKDGRVHYFSTDVGNAMSMPNPVTIPWVIDQFDDQLS
ncbi:iron siderophore-binding protein [Corynebacterium yudongzhengii]|uniref:Iron-siderophore ABC transporter substrate-binding protein n=1 Tax=Corynebacterium yudongzhengii TaxID=2080740 RepID=A0A2U1T839_9CORY|nr:iron-siderophore ABC transporter substrate-binding protein [Corynebacterium yudongzhengii]AWB82769.1 iron siderophore-binding protein [Corynebacterium yudongzhengii]PWC02171.1 iron-siderophore ABC transporter substrate-binding protein [Corynebacterium yudongzhengii]